MTRTPPSVLLLTAGLPIPVLFLAFAAPALLGAVVVALIPREQVPAMESARAVARPPTTV